MPEYVRKGEFREELQMHARILIEFYQKDKSSYDCARYLNEHGVPAGEHPNLEHGDSWFETLKEIMWETLERETKGDHGILMRFFVETTTSQSQGLLVGKYLKKDHPFIFTWYLKSVIDEMEKKYGSWNYFEPQSGEAAAP